MEAIIILADDWEGLFVDGKCVYEDHEIDRKTLRRLCKKHKLDFVKIKEGWVTEEYEEYLCDAGRLHEDLSNVRYKVD